jgi:predicted nucleic acid-binding protein
LVIFRIFVPFQNGS